jgi:hypothetical protein
MNLPLLGLTGSEPLAFLAALGALRGAARRWPDAHLAWIGDAPFQPELQLPDDANVHTLVETLATALREVETLDFFAVFGSDVKVPPGVFKKLLLDSTTGDNETSQALLDYLYALGNEMVADGSGKKLKPTAWHMTAGQQQFLDMARTLLRKTTPVHLHAALFQPWTYNDPPPAMRWDTSGERLYALEARNPSSVQIRTVRGANALGFLSLPFFPVTVVNRRLHTRGFIRMPSRKEFFVWPVWRHGLTAHVVPFLLGDSRLLDLLLDRSKAATALRTCGVIAAYQSERSVNDHGYGTLRPSEQIL